MYDVSDSFKIAMKKSAQKRSLRGTIAGIDFTQNNVLQGTFSITNQCSNSSDIQIGQTYIGELKATFRGVKIQRNSWKGKEIVPYQGLYIDEKEAFEEVLLGHYFVDSANWSRAGVSITAYDAMSKFDKELKINSSSGTWYDFVSFCCSQCGVEFALSKEDTTKFANANYVLEIYPENEMETYRDLLSWCAQAAGANAIINRDGKLTLKVYGGEVCDTFNDKQRLDGGSVSDFNTYYTGISFVDLGKQTTSYYAAERDDGLTMNLGGNPLLQLGSDKEVEARRTDVLHSVQNINYTPMTIKVNTPFVYDLMDVIELEGGIVGNDCIIKSTITKYTWQFAGDFEIVCSGSNPAIASGKSKVDKDISNLSNQVDSSKIVTYDFVNAKEINVGSEKENVVSIRFTSKIKATAMFLAEILIDVSTDSKALLEIFYRLNNEYIESFKPVQTYESGKQILTLYYPLLSLPDSSGNIFEVFFSMNGGTAKIDIGSALATITGQGLLALYYTPKWSGTIEIEEEFYSIDIDNNDLAIGAITESLSTKTQTPTASTITEVFSGILLDNSDITISTGIIEDIISRFVITASSINAENAPLCTYNADYVACDTAFKMITAYEYSAVEETIDSGRMEVLDMDFTQFASVSDVTLSGYTPSRLPSEYQEVEYIQNNNGSAYIVIPNVDTSFGVGIDMKVQRTSSANYQNIIVGDVFKICISNRISSGHWEYLHKQWSYDAGCHATPIVGYEPCEIKYRSKDGEQSLSVDGNVLITTSMADCSASGDFVVLGNNQNYYPFYGKVFYLKIYFNDEIKHELYPCYRKADNVAGMYDVITDTFYTNQGSGAFAVGEDV